MKQVLLGVAGVGAKPVPGEPDQLLSRDLPPVEIGLLESPPDPDIDGEGGRLSVGKQQDAVGDFWADPW
jgi:hypothetical protein